MAGDNGERALFFGRRVKDSVRGGRDRLVVFVFGLASLQLFTPFLLLLEFLLTLLEFV